MADIFASLIESFKNIGVSRAYGAPVQLGGEEVIPVAMVSFGFGGGGEAGQEGASGGGGGGMVLPLGVYRNVGGQVSFRPNTVVALVCLVPVITALGGAVRRAIRAAKA
ncbi:hypothetical protein [Arthrobacter nitrophenolicus]|uniref:Sporulation protein YtfJ n=1 Tax=Arthrobacter nitrophenolicus TaxID=683150 RepID=A0A4R5XNS1_9MICC|nr:hypothetical protein [Arthrobacter nitrophenolicus]TDL32336.1 hypothetical protein E2R57_19870 [Arthrobacter nitrophenolicus]